jgi:excisionase family DNA binding protein
LAAETFTVPEAAEYLEMSVPNFRRYVRHGQITPAQTVGRNQMFATRQLKALKRALHSRRQQFG